MGKVKLQLRIGFTGTSKTELTSQQKSDNFTTDMYTWMSIVRLHHQVCIQCAALLNFDAILFVNEYERGI